MSNNCKLLKIDMHMHSLFSDGTDSVEALIANVREQGIDLFSLTDHDSVDGCKAVMDYLKDSDFSFVAGVEFSCQDETGKYHILGYDYDFDSSEVCMLTEHCHNLRIKKNSNRINYLKENFGICFLEEEVDELLSLPNPGKPHIARLLMKHGYANSISEGIEKYLSKYQGHEKKITPKEAISAINNSNGISVLAHGFFGDGTKMFNEGQLSQQINHLKDCGLMGIECFYFGFSPRQEQFLVNLCTEKGILMTAGSDYHGGNKLIQLGDISMTPLDELQPYIKEILENFKMRRKL